MSAMNPPSGPTAPWLELQHHKGLYARLLFTETYYSFQLTDLVYVWSEHLVGSVILDRRQECQCPVELNDAAQILTFGKFLTKSVQNATTNYSQSAKLQTVQLGESALGKEIKFKFELSKMAEKEAAAILKQLILNLYDVVQNTGVYIQQLEQVNYEKDYHIRAMADAVARSTTYVPRRYECSYSQAFEAEKVPQADLSGLIVKFWPQPAPQSHTQNPPSSPVGIDSPNDEERLKRRADLKKIARPAKKSRLF